MVIAHIGGITAQVAVLRAQAITPCRTRHILRGLYCGILHNIDAMHTRLCIALGTHNGNKTRTRTDIEDAMRIYDIYPRTK
jgi:hypothetical protein